MGDEAEAAPRVFGKVVFSFINIIVGNGDKRGSEQYF